MAEQWYYQAFGQEFGPLTLDELAEMFQEGALSGDDLVREGKRGAWSTASQAKPLADLVVASAEVATDIDSFMLMDEKRETKPAAPDVNAVVEKTPKPVESRGLWYFQSIGVEFGPVPFSELLEMAGRGDIGPEDAVRKEKSGQWVPAGLIDGLFSDIPEETTVASTATAKHDRFATPSGLAQSSTAQAAARSKATAERSTFPQQAAYQTATESFETTSSFESTDSTDSGWYCFLNEQEYGPVDISELQTYVSTGQVTPEVYVKYGVGGEWTLAGQVPQLFATADAAAPIQANYPPTAPALPNVPTSPGKLADAERMELAHQLLALLKQEITPGLLASSAPPTAGGWYCNISGSVMGPVAIDALAQMVLQKRIFADDLIRLGTHGEWFPARTVPELFPQQGAPGAKKGGKDDANSVMAKIDKMYREAEEAKAKLEAEKAKAPASNSMASAPKPEPAKPAASGDVFRNINNSIARAAVEGKPKTGSTSSSSSGDSMGQQLNDLFAKMNMGSTGAIIAVVVIAVVGLGYFFGPGLLAGFTAGSSYEGMMTIHAEVMKAHSAGGDPASWEPKAKDIKKKVSDLMAKVKGGTGTSPLRDVSKMGLYLKEMAEFAVKKAPEGTPPEEDPFTIAQDRFKETQKKAAKKLGKKLK